MKILIAADMEGVSGVTTWTQVSAGNAEYERFRSIMTEDVNAAIGAHLMPRRMKSSSPMATPAARTS